MGNTTLRLTEVAKSTGTDLDLDLDLDLDSHSRLHALALVCDRSHRYAHVRRVSFRGSGARLHYHGHLFGDGSHSGYHASLPVEQLT